MLANSEIFWSIVTVILVSDFFMTSKASAINIIYPIELIERPSIWGGGGGGSGLQYEYVQQEIEFNVLLYHWQHLVND